MRKPARGHVSSQGQSQGHDIQWGCLGGNKGRKGVGVMTTYSLIPNMFPKHLLCMGTLQDAEDAMVRTDRHGFGHHGSRSVGGGRYGWGHHPHKWEATVQ